MQVLTFSGVSGLQAQSSGLVLSQTRQNSPYDVKEILEGVRDLFVRIGQFANQASALGVAQRVQQVVVLLMMNVVSGSLAQVLELSKDESKHVLWLQ